MLSIATSLRTQPPPSASIWNDRGQLVPLTPAPAVDHHADVAAIVVSRNRPDLVDGLVAQLRGMGRGLTMDIYVIEMGTQEDKLTAECSLRYDDPDFRGKCYGHNVGLRLARSKGTYRYYWILMNDLTFEDGTDAVAELVGIADAEPKLAILSPTERACASPDGLPRAGSDFHLVSSPDYLSLLIRRESVDEVGFLNPDFTYCWGAIHELAYKLHAAGWQIAYCDTVTMTHRGGTTYGQATGTVSRDEYQHRAKEFAARYFVEHYGKDWDDAFTRVLPAGIRFNTFRAVRRLWETVLDPHERRAYASSGVGALARRTLAAIRRPFADAALRREIDALHPWYYDVEIAGIKVTPGIGSKQTADELAGRVRYRTRLLVDEVVARCDVSGKRLLDLAANCAYWSARYAERGAASLLAVEGRADYVKQGRLYWKHNRFMENGAYEFLHGNVTSDATWETIRSKGPFDLSLCCGILYHIPDYEHLVRRIASATEQAVLIDTRVADDDAFVTEPGGWCFDAIVETRVKKAPDLGGLISLMDELGFAAVRLPADSDTPQGLKGADDYALGRRVALLCRRRE